MLLVELKFPAGRYHATPWSHNVNEGMRNQSIGAEQINEAMVSMTGNIRQTAGALEEFNRATAHLRSSVEGLNAEIAQFKT